MIGKLAILLALERVMAPSALMVLYDKFKVESEFFSLRVEQRK